MSILALLIILTMAIGVGILAWEAGIASGDPIRIKWSITGALMRRAQLQRRKELGERLGIDWDAS